ncbi:hypothetical protein CAPTEDRAFT_209331 [Capitella teleta]|uniref:CCHC-type domain-containing protein n=1 Tax=Capitella teleta TaxID=283909 RepID=R7TE20_CAPTE|nr:hypothetical protein CAPTEDRAFT_209331 [Capitella teleta]|eukprot:ELT92008.1 hypothetical protein CAPTEDRAFT_209331 [Capitella teleta]
MADWQNRLTDHFERQEARTALLDEADKMQTTLEGSISSAARGNRANPFYPTTVASVIEYAYPGGRNADQLYLLVRLYATGLKDRTLAEKIITPGKPNTLEQAQQRVAATEQKADNMVWLGYEAMEVDAFAASRSQQQRQEHTDVEKEVQILKTQYDKLEAKLDRLLEFNIRIPTATPSRVTTPRDDRQGVTCYYCGRLEHTQRECRTKQRDATGPRPTAAPHSTAATTAPVVCAM